MHLSFASHSIEGIRDCLEVHTFVNGARSKLVSEICQEFMISVTIDAAIRPTKRTVKNDNKVFVRLNFCASYSNQIDD